MKVMNQKMRSFQDLEAAYVGYLQVHGEDASVKSFEEWNDHVEYSFTCRYCKEKFTTYVPSEQKVFPNLCSFEHQALNQLAQLHPNDTAGIEAVLVKLQKMGLVREAMKTLNLINNDEYVQETYKPKRRQVPTTREHVQKVSKRRSTERMLDFRCPTPYKQMFRSLDEAQEFIDAVHPDDAGLEPYACTCGAHHFGHKKGTRRPKIPLVPSVSRSEALWCAAPKLPHYATAEAAEAYVAREVPTEVVELGVQVKKCSCNRYRLGFTRAAQDKKRQLRTKLYGVGA
jgi:hypothetical protein